MIKSAIKNKDKSIYILVKETGSGKTESIQKIIKEQEDNVKDMHSIDYNSLEKTHNQKATIRNIMQSINSCGKDEILLDGVVDHLDASNVHKFLMDLSLTKKKTIISTYNNEFIVQVLRIGRENSAKVNNSTQEDDKEIDFKIIANEHNLSWKDVYIHNYWWYAQYQNGSFTDLDNNNYKINEADFAALILASRYWGKANNIFNIDLNTNSRFFSEITTSFFHTGHGKLTSEEFFSGIHIPSYLDQEKIKAYLTDGQKLSFDLNRLENLVNEMSALKLVGLDNFVLSLYARQLFEEKEDKLSEEKSKEYSFIISSYAHAADFALIQIITRNSKKLLDVINDIKSL